MPGSVAGAFCYFVQQSINWSLSSDNRPVPYPVSASLTLSHVVTGFVEVHPPTPTLSYTWVQNGVALQYSATIDTPSAPSLHAI